MQAKRLKRLMGEGARVILVMEDEDAIAALLRTLLEEEGYTVMLAPNGREGLRLLREERVDLVMSDTMMPQVDGREVARAMRADAAYDGIPLVLMSSAGARIVTGVPYTAFLTKPFELDTLFARVARLLSEPLRE